MLCQRSLKNATQLASLFFLPTWH